MGRTRVGSPRFVGGLCGGHYHRRMQTSRILPWLALSVGLTAAPLSAQGVERELSPSGEWIVADQPAPGTPEAALAEARRALAEGRYAHAERLAERWIENHPEHELLPEAY